MTPCFCLFNELSAIKVLLAWRQPGGFLPYHLPLFPLIVLLAAAKPQASQSFSCESSARPRRTNHYQGGEVSAVRLNVGKGNRRFHSQLIFNAFLPNKSLNTGDSLAHFAEFVHIANFIAAGFKR